MSTFTLVTLIIFFIIAAFIVYKIIAFKTAGKKISKQRFERVQKLYEKLESGEEVLLVDIYEFAKNIQTRETTFQLLNDRDLTNLFPQEFYTIEKAAESNLANWLEFPTELGTCPDEMQHLERVTIDYDGKDNFVHYEVFKCRVNEPHWAAKNGWFLGVVGPYFDDSKPYDFPQCTFSRISSTIDKHSAREEATWVHENISNKR